jgi:hypothetical protein
MRPRKAKRRASGADRPAKVRKAPILHDVAWWALLLLAIIPLTLCEITTSDCWWHLQCGRSLIQNWRTPDFHSFYFTPIEPHVLDLRWTFLGDIILYGSYAIGGMYAIQCLIVLIVICAILLTLSMGRWRHEWLTLPLTIAFALGTYQLQLHRNAAFSILFVVSIFWIFFQYRERQIKWMIWLYPPLIGVWGTIHGSYLLGLVLVFLLLAGDAVDLFMDGAGAPLAQLGRYLLVICAAFTLTQLWNPYTTTFFLQPFRHLQSQDAGRKPIPQQGKETNAGPSTSDARSESADPLQSAAPSIATPALQRSLPTQTAADRIKKFLNNSIWPEIDSLPRSGDFLSPFDRLEYRPVIVSFAFGFIALFDLLFCSNRCRFSLLIPLAGVFALGMAYFRCTGYIAAIGFCAMAINSQWRNERLALILRRGAWISISASVIWIVALYLALFTGTLPELIAEPNHVSGFGKIPTYDDRICDYVRETYPDKNVFTTIVSGSFALFKWYPNKKVFIDGFFAPHPFSLWQDYKEVRRLENPNLLHDRYGAELALVEHDRFDWNVTFLNSNSWQPVAIGLGDVLYRYQANRSSKMPVLLFKLPEVAQMPPHFRQKLAYNYYSSITSMARFGDNSLTLTKADHDIFYGLLADLAPDERHLFDEAASHVRFE